MIFILENLPSNEDIRKVERQLKAEEKKIISKKKLKLFMNNRYLFLKIILILIYLFGLKSVYAQEAFPYLFIQYEDNIIFELKLSNDFLIENQSGILEIRGSLLENPITMPLKTISLFGIMYKETVTDDAGMDSFIDNTVNDIWQVYDIKGSVTSVIANLIWFTNL